MKRTERHHLKENELITGLEHATDWTRVHGRMLINGLLVLAGAALLLGGLYIHRTRQSERAQALLAEALRRFHGVVGTEAASEAAGAPRFATAEEKYRAALSSFETIATEYSSYDPGRKALYYQALCQIELKDFDAAAKSLQDVRSGTRDLLYYLASRALAALKTDRGEHAAAAEIYRPLVDDASNPLPKDHLLFELARVEERSGNPTQARQYYERMLAEHPDSQLRGDATTRSELLKLDESQAAGG